MDFQAEWIQPAVPMGDVCPVFRKVWKAQKGVEKAELFLTACGVYDARVNGRRVSSVLAPGWTAYRKRLQYQQYDVTAWVQGDNELAVTVGKGWYRSPMPGWAGDGEKRTRAALPAAIWGELRVRYEDGTIEAVPTDSSWVCGESAVRFSEIYDGEAYDAQFAASEWKPVRVFDGPGDTLIPQEGEEIREMERGLAKSVFRTPRGELLVDFGQEVTGYVEFTVTAEGGEKIRILHGEALDADGNFYRDNYRSAKAEIRYTCKRGTQTWHPLLTFFGFRYIKLEEFPGMPEADQFAAVAVYSDIRRTGELS